MKNFNFSDDNYCIVCGENNPIGLKQKFTIEEEELVTYFNLPKEFQGWNNVAHGGIVSTLLDEVQVTLLGTKGITVVTAEITVRLKKPVMTMEKYRCAAKIEKEIESSKLVLTSAYISDKNGNIYAESTAKLIKKGTFSTDKIKI